MPEPTPDQKYAQQVAAGVDPATASANAYGTGSGAQGNQDPPVFAGQWAGQLTGAPGGRVSSGFLTGSPAGGQQFVGTTVGGQQDTRHPVMQSSSDAIFWMQNGLFNHDPAAQAMRQQMIDAGLIDPTTDLNGVLSAWAKMVSLSAGAAAKGQYVTPGQYVSMWAAQVQHDPQVPVTWRSTSTTRTVHSQADLEGAFQNTATGALGRRATPAEAAAAAGSVGAQAAAHPTTSTTTQTTDNKGHTQNSNTTTREGFGTDAINEALLQQAMANPSYAEFQAAGHYFPALLSALGAVTPAGL